ncbi:MAG: hypothetical protein ACREEB_07600 [Caulobacteraceae bacterium]
MILQAADQLSDMANKVAAFAISADLVLIIACLKDIAIVVKNKTLWFEVGLFVGGCFYASIVWVFHCKELELRNLILGAGLREVLDPVNSLLLRARMGGIATITAVSMFAVWGTARAYRQEARQASASSDQRTP